MAVYQQCPVCQGAARLTELSPHYHLPETNVLKFVCDRCGSYRDERGDPWWVIPPTLYSRAAA